MMKNRLFVLLLVVLVLVATGCNKKKETETTSTTVPETTEEAASEEDALPGLQDNVFEDLPVETSETEEETKPENLDKDDSVKSTEDSDPIETTPTTPGSTKPRPTEPGKEETTEPAEEGTSGSEVTTYEQFHNLSPADQKAYVESFSDMDAFFAWYNEVKDAHDKANAAIEIDGSNIDIGTIIEDKN